MDSMPKYVQVICGLLVVSLMVVAILYIWFPEMVSQAAFMKVTMTFVVILMGSVVLGFLGKTMCGKRCEDSKDSAS